MKIWYSVTRIPSIFQTSTHVWGKSINCLSVLGSNCLTCTFGPYKKQIPVSTLRMVFCLIELYLPHSPLFPLPFSENSFSFSLSLVLLFDWTEVINQHIQSPVLTWSFSVPWCVSVPCCGKERKRWRNGCGLAARSCRESSYFLWAFTSSTQRQLE